MLVFKSGCQGLLSNMSSSIEGCVVLLKFSSSGRIELSRAAVDAFASDNHSPHLCFAKVVLSKMQPGVVCLRSTSFLSSVCLVHYLVAIRPDVVQRLS